MKQLLSNAEIFDVVDCRVKSLITGNIGIVIGITGGPPYLMCMKHDLRHKGCVNIEWTNGNESYHPICDYDSVEILEINGMKK